MRTTRRGRRGLQTGQAVLETALVIPILLALCFGYAAIVIQVEAQARLTASVELATNGLSQVGVGAHDPGCLIATSTFYGTLYQHDPSALKPAASANCTGSPSSLSPSSEFVQVSSFNCNDIGRADSQYLAGTPTRSVHCRAVATLDFSKSVLGWVVFWKPVVTVDGNGFPTQNRQCGKVGNTCTAP
jgi:hypothetical protein